MPAPESIGRYRVERRLGSGAFAVVWLAHDERLRAPVAVKVMAENWAFRTDIRERFLTEAQMLRKATSEGVVQVFDVGELDDERPYFVMEYADLGTVADLLEEGPLPVPEALRITERAARGAHALHEAGVVHRDLKPSNVLLARGARAGRERVLVADLGLAKNLAQASGLTVVAGSTGYMAPEQSEPYDGIDARADVYGLGAVLYHLVTGTVPGPAGRMAPADRVRPGLPQALVRALTRALEPDREHRWPTAAAFADELARLASGSDAGQGMDSGTTMTFSRPPFLGAGPARGAPRAPSGTPTALVGPPSGAGGSAPDAPAPDEAAPSDATEPRDAVPAPREPSSASGSGPARPAGAAGASASPAAGTAAAAATSAAAAEAASAGSAAPASAAVSSPDAASPAGSPPDAASPAGPPGEPDTEVGNTAGSGPAQETEADAEAGPDGAAGQGTETVARAGATASEDLGERRTAPGPGAARGTAPAELEETWQLRGGLGTAGGGAAGQGVGTYPAAPYGSGAAAGVPGQGTVSHGHVTGVEPASGAGEPLGGVQGSSSSIAGPPGAVSGPASGAGESGRLRGRRGRSLAIGTALAVLLGGAGAGAYVLGRQDPSEPPSEIRVSDASGRISVEVPGDWAKETAGSGWRPSALGLSDQSAPGLTVAQDVSRWQDLTAPVSGVFVGLGTDGRGAGGKKDQTAEQLPRRVGAIDHKGCVPRGNRSFRSGSWSGSVRSWSSCDSPGHGLEEIALSSGKSGIPPVYVQIRCDQDCKARTDRVLRSLRVHPS